MKREPRIRDPLFQLVPLRSLLIFFIGVFCIFAPLSMLFESALTPSRSPLAIGLLMAVSGGIAVCWAGAFMVSAPVIVFAFIMQRYLVEGLTMGAVK